MQAVQNNFNAELVIVGDPKVIADRAKTLGANLEIVEYRNNEQPNNHRPGKLTVLPIKANEHVSPGVLNKNNSDYVIRCIETATEMCLSHEFDAMVTAPAHKGIINDAGIIFTGHTEWIATLCKSKLPVMMLATKDIRVCLATTHIPLSKVSENIFTEQLETILKIMVDEIARLYGMTKPRIGVCGLNPHAGEGGHLGSEEIETITPAINNLKNLGFDVSGPFPADTIFVKSNLTSYDAILAMYHDQGLPVIKHSGFGEVVNVTLGLPIIRTSVDHGTALDLAGSGSADSSSLVAAINLAIEFSINNSN